MFCDKSHLGANKKNKNYMEFIIKGKIQREGLKKAKERFDECRELLSCYGINFPPFVCGTLNVELDKEFPTPNWTNIVFISQKEIDKYASGYGEWWKFISVKEINGKETSAFIFRSKQNPHGDKVAELIAPDIELSNGSAIEIKLSNGDNQNKPNIQ